MNNEKTLKRKRWSLIIVLILIILIAIYLAFRKHIMYSYYVMRGNNSIIESEQLEYYNKALGFKYTNAVLDDIYDSLEGNDKVSDEISKVSNLKENDRNNIIIKVYQDKAEEAFSMEKYNECAYYLRQAENNGYNIKEYKNYNKLKQSLEESGQDTLASEYRSGNSKDAYFKDDSKYNQLVGYIIPDSYSRKLTKDELEKYDYDTLGLIRAEILARHGFAFTDDKYKNYFENKDWYSKDVTFKGTNAEINEYERYNIELIKEIQDEKSKN